MATLATGSIILSNVNDAYSAVVSPSSFAIVADADGNNPQLDNLSFSVSLQRGGENIEFELYDLEVVNCSLEQTYSSSKLLSYKFVSLKAGAQDGEINIELRSKDAVQCIARTSLAFTVVKETTMLDWIQDWDGSKTKIGDTYMMTLKLFVGCKSDSYTYNTTTQSYELVEGALTGVYIGPDIYDATSTGIFGYKADNKIFKLDQNGGEIGGWIINPNNIASSNGLLTINSTGSIIAKNTAGNSLWALRVDGSSMFANGQVQFNANGSGFVANNNISWDAAGNATFNGTLTSQAGTIGGWNIGTHSLWQNGLLVDSEGYIGLTNGTFTNEPSLADHTDLVASNGGIYIRTHTTKGGEMVAYNPSGNIIFRLSGNDSYIGPWQFGPNSIYYGTEVTSGYAATNHITIGTTGLRSCKWQLNQDGSAYFAGGLTKFNADGSGSLADGNITWTTAGAVTINGTLMVTSSEGNQEGLQTVLNSIFSTENGLTSTITSYNTGAGRNLLLGTNLGADNWSAGSTQGNITMWTSTMDSDNYGAAGSKVYTGFQRIDTGTDNTYEYFAYALRPELIQPGATYTLSFLTASDYPALLLRISEINSSNKLIRDCNLTRTWLAGNNCKYTVTFTALDSDSIAAYGSQRIMLFMQSTATGNEKALNQWSSFGIRDLKLERGTVATTWTAAPEDYSNTMATTLRSEISQTANSISLQVFKDCESAGLTIDTENGITLQADKVTVKNGDTTTAMFANGILNADLLSVGKVLAYNSNGDLRTAVNRLEDGAIEIFYPSTEAGREMPIALELGVVTETTQDDEGNETSVTSLLRYYNKNGKLLWRLTPNGLVAPSYSSTMYVATSSTPYSVVNSQQIWDTTEYLANATFYIIYSATSKGQAHVDSSDSSSLRDDGTYYGTTVNHYMSVKHAITGQYRYGVEEYYTRAYYVISGGKLTDQGDVYFDVNGIQFTPTE